jgi:hypothetical protein
MKSVPLGSQNTVEFTTSLPFSQHSHSTSIFALSLATNGVRSQIDRHDFVRLRRKQIGTTL